MSSKTQQAEIIFAIPVANERSATFKPGAETQAELAPHSSRLQSQIGLAIGHCKEESSSFADFSFNPSASAMARDNSSYYRQANPSTLEFRVAMEPLKRGEELVSVSHIE